MCSSTFTRPRAPELALQESCSNREARENFACLLCGWLPHVGSPGSPYRRPAYSLHRVRESRIVTCVAALFTCGASKPRQALFTGAAVVLCTWHLPCSLPALPQPRHHTIAGRRDSLSGGSLYGRERLHCLLECPQLRAVCSTQCSSRPSDTSLPLLPAGRRLGRPATPHRRARACNKELCGVWPTTRGAHGRQSARIMPSERSTGVPPKARRAS